MTKEQAKARIEKLRALVEKYRYAYHVLDKSLVSDAVNDSLKHELQELEGQFPELVTGDSPTQRVGGEPLEEFKEVRHSTPMLSLTDAFSKQELQEWFERAVKFYGKSGHSDFYCELKMDGLAVALIYHKGVLRTGATRGNGLVGEDVTQNLKTVEAIPLRLQYRPTPHLHRYESAIKDALVGTIEIRGEVFMTKKALERLNEAQRKNAQKVFANPRNVAAGSVRQLNPKITVSRELDFYAYAIPTELGLKTHEEEHLLCAALGVKVNPHNKLIKDVQGVVAYHKHWEGKKDKLDYWFDGVVVTINERQTFKHLGVVGKAPRGVVAFKFAATEATTILEDIKVQVGRTGKLTPVAHLKPVQVSGVTVSRATLHNQDEIERKDVRIGDTVVVRRAGEVIPEVVRPLKELRPRDAKTFRMPTKCPFCGSQVVRPEGEVDHRCSNKHCLATRLQELEHFVSKAGFDIERLGPKIIEQLVNEGLVKDAADLFGLNEGDLEPLERFAEKSAQNIVAAIRARKTIELPRFLYALGIRHVGEETALDIAAHFGNLERIRTASAEEYNDIYGVGEKVGASIVEWFAQQHNKELVTKLLRHARVTSGHSGVKQTLRGKLFVLTGALETITRDEAKEKIRRLGGSVSETVSKQTDYVVAGSEPGAKYERAKELGVRILEEKQFLALLGSLSSKDTDRGPRD